MVDCILQEWLKRHPKFEYPVDPQVPDGHRRDDYVRGYFPLYTNGEILTRAEEFGFYCNLPNLGMTQPIGDLKRSISFSFFLFLSNCVYKMAIMLCNCYTRFWLQALNQLYCLACLTVLAIL